jgi:hypothetical protein
MKTFICVAVILSFQTLAFASECLNYSGRYRAVGLEFNTQELTINQNGCVQIRMEFKTKYANGAESSWVQELIVDGQKRQIATDYTAAYRWDGSAINESGSVRSGDGTFVTAYGRWAFDSNGRLVYRWNASQGIGIHSVYERR